MDTLSLLIELQCEACMHCMSPTLEERIPDLRTRIFNVFNCIETAYDSHFSETGRDPKRFSHSPDEDIFTELSYAAVLAQSVKNQCKDDAVYTLLHQTTLDEIEMLIADLKNARSSF